MDTSLFIIVIYNFISTLEAGTHNVHGAAGLLEGLRFVRGLDSEHIQRQEAAVMEVLRKGLAKKGWQVLGEGPVLSAVPPREAPETTADRLAEKGAAVRAGLHCAPLAHMTGGTIHTGTVRFSASVFNTPAEAEQVLAMV